MGTKLEDTNAERRSICQITDTGNSRGFGFVSFETFEASDAANPYPYHVYHQGVRGALPTRAPYP